MKGYKAFEKGMICRGKQYAENTVFEEDEAVICEKGMHFCERPLDVLDYYPLIDDNGDFTEFAEVEALDDPVTDDNKKYCTKKLKIGAKITFKNLVDAFIGYVKEETKINSAKQVGGDYAQQVGGNSAQQVGGDYAQQVGGDYAKQVGGDPAKQVGGYSAKQVGGNSAKQVGGDYAKQVGGYSAQQVGGYYAQQVGGNSAQQVGGNYAKQVGGDDAQQVGGNYAQQVGGYSAKQVGGNSAKQVGGDYAKQVGSYYAQQVGGKNSILVNGTNSVFKAGLHSVIVCCEYDEFGNLKSPNVIQVDGEKIKADTWYTLKNGEFVEVDNAKT